MQYADFYAAAGKQYGVDPRLLASLVQVESAGRKDAKSSKGAVGVAQIMPDTAKSLGVDPKDPKASIFAAAKLLRENMDRYGTPDQAILAYHGGTDKTQWGPKTQAYLSKVANTYRTMAETKSQVDFKAKIAEARKAGYSDADIRAYMGKIKGFQDVLNTAKGHGYSDDEVYSYLGLNQPQQQQQQKGKTLNTPIREGVGVPAKDKVTLKKPVNTMLGSFLNLADYPLFGAADELVGAGGAARMALEQLMEGQPVTFGKNYERAVNTAREAKTSFSKEHPYISGLNNTLGLLGSVFTGEPIAQATQPVADALSKAGHPLLGRMAQGGLSGATAGGIYGYESADQPDQRLDYAGTNALVGGLTGTAAPLVFEGGKYLGRLAKSAVRPLTEGGRQQIAREAIEHYAGGPLSIDATELVPGSKPTMVEATPQNAGVASLQRTIRDLNQNSPFVQREGEQAAARNALFDTVAGHPQDIEAAREALSRIGPQEVFSSPSAANPKPVVDKIDEILSGPSGKRPAVQQALGDVRSILVGKDGAPVTDAQTLYDSVRKGIGDLLDKKDLSKGYGKQAARELISVRDVLDNVLDEATGGKFGQYLSDYAEQAKPVNAMEYLQGMNLTDAKGNITLAKVQSALTRLSRAQSAPGVASAKSVTEPQIEALRSIRDDLLRSKNIELGRSLGSNTAQNLASQQFLKNLLPGKAGAFVGSLPATPTMAGVGTTVGGTLGSMFGPAGSIVGATTGGTLGGALSKMSNDAVQRQVENMLLNPQAYQQAVQAANQAAGQRQIQDMLMQKLFGPQAIPTYAQTANRLLSPPPSQ